MAKLNLSIAVRDYDRTRPLTDGTVQIDGVDPVFMALDPEDIFFRSFRHPKPDIKLDPAPEGATLNAMLEAGEIDAFIGPRTPSCFEQGKPNIGWLWPEPMTVAKDYFGKTGNFPIMHMIGVRRVLVEQHPWLPAAVLKAFTRAKSICLALLEETSASKVTLPFMEEQVKRS